VPKVAKNPSLNLEDLPEASQPVPGTSKHLKAPWLRTARKSGSDCIKSNLPCLKEDNQYGDHDTTAASYKAEAALQELISIFPHHSPQKVAEVLQASDGNTNKAAAVLLETIPAESAEGTRCETQNIPAFSAKANPPANDENASAAVGQEPWPSLEEARDPEWAFCDVSSVASSWIDVGDDVLIVEAEEAEEGTYIINSKDEGKPAPVAYSWASRVAAAGCHSSNVRSGAAKWGVSMPPLQKARLGMRKSNISVCHGMEDRDDDDGCITDLTVLESRRLHPTGPVGGKHRRHVGRAR